MIASLLGSSDIQDIAEKLETGCRLDYGDGVRLFRTPDLTLLGSLAHRARLARHGKKTYYANYLNLNPTNVCAVGCLFCSFARYPGEEGGYALSRSEIEERVRRARETNRIREVHIVGGLNDGLPLDYYFDVVATVKAIDPELFVKAYTAVEVDYFARRGKMSYTDVLSELKARGLDMLPGGGAEIFAERVRRKICLKKITADEWLEVHRVAHGLGLKSNATMLYGHIENEEDRVDHILRLRALQDETGGFNSFIPLAYQDDNNPLSKLVKDHETDGMTDLKIYAVSRLLFDNCPHLKGYWTTIGLRFAQVALAFGVDDLGGTAFSEKIMHDAGVNTPVSCDQGELARVIRQAGFEPCEVVSSYDQIFS